VWARVCNHLSCFVLDVAYVQGCATDGHHSAGCIRSYCYRNRSRRVPHCSVSPNTVICTYKQNRKYVHVFETYKLADTWTLTCRAAAKSGKTVLHLDQAENYGSAWSSLTLDQFLAWTERQAGCESLSPAEQQAAPQDTAASNAQDLVHVPVPHQQAALYSNVQLHRQHVELGSSREFSLDLAGKAGICYMCEGFHCLCKAIKESWLQVVFCASETIDTMLAFGVQNYLEFKLFQGRYDQRCSSYILGSGIMHLQQPQHCDLACILLQDSALPVEYVVL